MFDASNTVDPEGAPLIYFWDFGDGTPAPYPSRNPKASHTYEAVGEYTAHLAVANGGNSLVLAEVTVSITDVLTPPAGDTWALISPFSFVELRLTLKPFATVLLVEITEPDGASSKAIGMDLDDLIFWMDHTGAIYYGVIDRKAGTMAGFSFGELGGGIWYAKRVESKKG